MDIPARSVKLASDFRALVMAGFCPLMVARSAAAASRSLASRIASPTPMFTTIFSRRGARMGLSISSSRIRAGSTSCMYRSLSRGAGAVGPGRACSGRAVGVSFSAMSDLRLATPADPDLDPGILTVPDPRGLPAGLAHHHDVREVDELFLQDDAAGLASARRGADGEVALGPGHPLHHDPVLPRQDVDHPAALAAVLAGDHLTLVVLLDINRPHQPRLLPVLTAPREPT